MTIGQFIHILSSRLELTPGKALFIFVKNTLPQTGKIKHLIDLDIVTYTQPSYRNLLTRAIYLQQVKWILSMNLTRKMTDFFTCATAAKKPLAKLVSSFLLNTSFLSLQVSNNYLWTCLYGSKPDSCK